MQLVTFNPDKELPLYSHLADMNGSNGGDEPFGALTTGSLEPLKRSLFEPLNRSRGLVFYGRLYKDSLFRLSEERVEV